MRVLVTGAGGFIGREVLRTLELETSHDVIALDTGLHGISATARRTLVPRSLRDAALQEPLSGGGIDAVIHLAAVPGGAAELSPLRSREVNIDATLELLDTVTQDGSRPRFVFASTIAVLGDHLPATGVDDAMQLAPRLIYGAHKAMIETMLATLDRRGALSGIALRLPGIVARPRGPSGMKSAFMSNMFHALQAREPFVSPVSQRATLWLMSVKQVARNLVYALTADEAVLPPTRVATLPALRVEWAGLIEEVARQCGAAPGLVTFEPDTELEAAFGAYPPLLTPAAERAGFAHDGNVATLVTTALEHIRRE